MLRYLGTNNASPTLNIPYEPSATYSCNAENKAGGINVTKTATRTYSVKCTGVAAAPAAGGLVQVSGYGNGIDIFWLVWSWSIVYGSTAD